jgi:osmoprotectant transport system permease protein
LRRPLVEWDWIFGRLDQVWARTVEHLQLTGAAVLIGLVLAMALSVIALRFPSAKSPVTWFTGVLYTIPSLAFFVLLIPFTGLSLTTAVVPLVAYTLLMLVRNIVAGIEGVPAAAREAALGMGYRRWRILLRVEIPLALPVIMAGVRIATVTTVGLVTITGLIGYGGYGFFIFDGIRRDFSTPLMLGGGLAMAMAIALDMALLGVQRAVTPWARRARA